MCNTAAKIGQEQAWNDRAALVREQGLQPIASTAASRWFTEPFIQSNATVVNNLQNDLAAGSAEGYASCCEALAKADVREQLKDDHCACFSGCRSARPCDNSCRWSIYG